MLSNNILFGQIAAGCTSNTCLMDYCTAIYVRVHVNNFLNTHAQHIETLNCFVAENISNSDNNQNAYKTNYNLINQL